MMKISDELKQVPSWLEGFKKEKLYLSDEPILHYLIWMLQVSAVYSLLMPFYLMIQMGMYAQDALMAKTFAASASTMMMSSFFTVAMIELTILGIQKRSKLAWVLLVTSALHTTFSFLFPLGLLMLAFLNRDEVVNYFCQSSSNTVSSSA